MTTVKDCRVIFHGRDFESYFPGQGVANTPYDDVFTGIGETLREAYEEAVEQAVCSGLIFTAQQTAYCEAAVRGFATVEDSSPLEENEHHYVSLFVAVSR